MSAFHPNRTLAAQVCYRGIADTSAEGQDREMSHRFCSCICAVLSLAACHSPQLALQQSQHSVFLNPAAFVGQKVQLCGFFQAEFENSNVWPTKSAVSHDQGGLGFIPASENGGDRRLHDKQACINAQIVRTGCAEETVCSWSNFPYAAREVR
jgi:hypothetical protein